MFFRFILTFFWKINCFIKNFSLLVVLARGLLLVLVVAQVLLLAIDSDRGFPLLHLLVIAHSHELGTPRYVWHLGQILPLLHRLLLALVLRKVHRLVDEGGFLVVLERGLLLVVEESQVLEFTIECDIGFPLLALLVIAHSHELGTPHHAYL